MKKIIVIFFFVLFAASFSAAEIKPLAGSRFSSSLKPVEQSGEKTVAGGGFSILGVDVIKPPSFEECFDVRIDYTNYYFVTEEGLPGYYIGLPMTCDVIITNTSGQDFEDLTVTMVHEYYESGVCDRWWSPPNPVKFEKNEQLPGDSAMVWAGVTVKKGETISLPFEYTCPYETCAGLDQTHVIIESGKQTSETEDDYVLELYNNNEAGVYCPPPPQ